jgi:hypothetical protein
MLEFEGFDWDLRHATRHGVTREEMEGVVR